MNFVVVQPMINSGLNHEWNQLAPTWIKEPSVEKEALKMFPDLDDELRVPNFVIYFLNKQ
jgi:hypothetical protein